MRDDAADGRPVRILCIGATGQSGSTLLTRMIGRLPGAAAVGEVGRIWDKGVLDNTPCGCGAPFLECPFWTRVGEEAFGGWGRVDVRRALALRREVHRERRHLSLPRAMPFLVRPSLSRRHAAAEREYLGLLAPIYRAVVTVSGAEVVVDSMKEPPHVYALTRLPGAELRVVHQVRDSRGVAYSNERVVPRQGSGPGVHRRRSKALNTGARWLWINLAYEALPRLGVPVLRVRYEDVIGDARSELRRIAGFAGFTVDDEALGFLGDGTADLPPDHLAAGNRVRLSSGPFVLRRDEQWRTGLRRRDRVLVTALTWPLMRRYAGRSADHQVLTSS